MTFRSPSPSISNVKNQPQNRYTFELLCLDVPGINSEQGLARALSFGPMWEDADPAIRTHKGIVRVDEPATGVLVNIYSIDTSLMLTDYQESAFVISAESRDFAALEKFRLPLLEHLRATLEFRHVRILADTVSTEVANQLYPAINRVESRLRRYLTKFFIQRVGLNWWRLTATRVMTDKVKTRREQLTDKMSKLVELDVNLVDFDDLGELIYKQTTGFNNTEAIVERLLDVKSYQGLLELQGELQGNYTKYFKRFFQDKHFKHKWQELYRIRNKVAHHGTFYAKELERGQQLCEDLLQIITEAESQIDKLVFSVEDKQAIREAVNDQIEQEQSDAAEAAAGADDADGGEPVVVAAAGTQTKAGPTVYRARVAGPKVVGRIELPRDRSREQAIDEATMCELLELESSKTYNDYVGLKWFVTSHLADKGFAINSSYSLANVLIDQGKIEMYDVTNSHGYQVKAIRLPA